MNDKRIERRILTAVNAHYHRHTLPSSYLAPLLAIRVNQPAAGIGTQKLTYRGMRAT